MVFQMFALPKNDACICDAIKCVFMETTQCEYTWVQSLNRDSQEKNNVREACSAPGLLLTETLFDRPKLCSH